MQWMRFCKHFYDPDIKTKTGISSESCLLTLFLFCHGNVHSLVSQKEVVFQIRDQCVKDCPLTNHSSSKCHDCLLTIPELDAWIVSGAYPWQHNPVIQSRNFFMFISVFI